MAILRLLQHQRLFFGSIIGYLLLASLPALGQQQAADHWTIYIDSVKLKEQAWARKNPSTYQLLALSKVSKRYSLRSKGIEVVRQIDSLHYIVRSGPAENKHLENSEAGKIYPTNDLWKLAPALLRLKMGQPLLSRSEFYLKSQDPGLFKKQLLALAAGHGVEVQEGPGGLLLVRCSYQSLFELILPMEGLIFVDAINTNAKEESPLRDANLSVNKVNRLQHEYPQLNGQGLVASVKENSINPDDLDVRGRYLTGDQESKLISRHATEMATILAGGGSSSPRSRGVAWAVSLSSSDFARLFPDPDSYFATNGISVQNHSYGTAIENYYGALARAYDLHTHQNPALVHVFSAGNQGKSADTLGAYKAAEGFANLTGNFKMAKNILVVGALDGLKAPDTFISKGPAYDGRLKPELVAYSTEGSSNAAALVSGVVSLLQQTHQQQQGVLPPAALVKAVLVNSAEDVGPKGIDFFSGYGNVDAYAAYKTLSQERFFTDSLRQQEVVTFPLSIPPDARNLKISLVWTDPAAEPNAAKALVNDLDLSLVEKASGKSWLPWVLNAFPQADSLQLPARRAEDHLNTIEQLSLQQPLAGDYIIKVSAYDVPEGLQSFFVAYQWEEAEDFSWTFPTGSDNMPEPGEDSGTFRWESTFSAGEKGILEYSVDKGESWKTISRELDLQEEMYQWEVPDIYGAAIVRMRVGTEVFSSDTFSIFRQMRPTVGFNCQDSVMLSWKAMAGIENYVVYKMGDKYLEPLAVSKDSFFVFQKQELTSQYFAVAPKFNGHLEGVRSQGFDYAMQGVDCFLAFFHARSEKEGVQLTLKLGTAYQLAKVHLERKEGNAFLSIQSFGTFKGTTFQYLDEEVKQGVNQYRVRLELKNGQEITSGSTAVYFLTSDSFLVFPNPVNRQEELRIFSGDLKQDKIFFTLFSQEGKTLLKKEVLSLRESVSLSGLDPGMYYYSISGSRSRESGKLIIY